MGRIKTIKCQKCGYEYQGNEIKIEDKDTMVYSLDALALRNECCKENVKLINE